MRDSPTTRKLSGHYIRQYFTSARFVNLAVNFLYGITLYKYFAYLEKNF